MLRRLFNHAAATLALLALLAGMQAELFPTVTAGVGTFDEREESEEEERDEGKTSRGGLRKLPARPPGPSLGRPGSRSWRLAPASSICRPPPSSHPPSPRRSLPLHC